MIQAFRRLSAPAALSLILILQSIPATPAGGCEKLASFALPNATIDSAQIIAPGAFRPPAAPTDARFSKAPAFCRIRATLTPNRDSEIKTEVWLPATGWNGKLQALGNSGWGGEIPYNALLGALMAGYAAAATDGGHTGNNAEFAMNHPQKLIDFAYRAVHEMTVEAKAVIRAYYGKAARYSYFNGCSQGGRQGLTEAQTYPQDFDGIIAGAASWDQMRVHAARVALNGIVNRPGGVIPPGQYPMIHKAVLNACDALDAVHDGVIENPQACRFDYAEIACRTGQARDCLTPDQVRSAKAMTSPLTDPKTGRVLFAWRLMPGSELGWARLGGPQPLSLAVSAMRHIVFHNRKWDYRRMDISADVDRAVRSDDGALYSGDPNLTAFFRRGGKLLMYHGWNDPQVSPMSSIIYYENVLKTVAAADADDSIVLFMIPGMNHCGGGPGTDAFNKVRVMEDWVEHGEKPAQIIASHISDGEIDKTRPLCPYPRTAHYVGAGSTADAKNFVCSY